jgi:hypothetical protein
MRHEKEKTCAFPLFPIRAIGAMIVMGDRKTMNILADAAGGPGELPTVQYI